MSDDKPLHRLKTGAFSRRLELSKVGLRYGTRAVRQQVWQRLTGDSDKAQQKRRDNIDFFIGELGKLKGSVVKIGQMMATYGDYLMPPELADALHKLEDDTPPMSWRSIEKVLRRELGEGRFEELEIQPEAFAAASLGQVHRAIRRGNEDALCIKVQYPGVDQTIDADFSAVMGLLRLSRLMDSTRNLDEWFGDIRQLLHKEVDYEQERRDLEFVAQALADDPRYVVPRSYPDYCTRHVLTMSYEAAEPISSPAVAALSQARRNRLGAAILEEFLMELFAWQRMQTDPNFGNYRVRIDPQGEDDQVLLLDFGAMRLLPASFATPFCEMLVAGYRRDRETFLAKAIELGFMKPHFPAEVLENFTDIGIDIAEPLRKVDDSVPLEARTELGEYNWRASNLPKRIAKRAVAASISRYFALPPKDFLYVMRKLMGVYALIAQLDARFDGEPILKKFIDD